MKTGAPYGSPLTADTSPVNDVAFSPDGRTLVSAHLRSAVVWNMNGEQAIGQPLGGPADLTTDVAFSPDGRGSLAGRLRRRRDRVDTATGRQLPGSRSARSSPRSPSVRTGTSSPSRRSTAGSDSSTRRPARPSAAARRAGRPVWQVAFSPDGNLLAVAVDPNGVDGFYGQRREGEVQLWDVGSRRRVGRAIRPGAGSVLSARLRPDGTLLATGSFRGRLDLWDVATRPAWGSP